eukprot:scaffold1149_cov173-Skeletonema_marinoi.AAC.12
MADIHSHLLLGWTWLLLNHYQKQQPGRDKASPLGMIALLSADCLEDGPVVCSCCDYCGEAL